MHLMVIDPIPMQIPNLQIMNFDPKPEVQIQTASKNLQCSKDELNIENHKVRNCRAELNSLWEDLTPGQKFLYYVPIKFFRREVGNLFKLNSEQIEKCVSANDLLGETKNRLKKQNENVNRYYRAIYEEIQKEILNEPGIYRDSMEAYKTARQLKKASEKAQRKIRYYHHSDTSAERLEYSGDSNPETKKKANSARIEAIFLKFFIENQINYVRKLSDEFYRKIQKLDIEQKEDSPDLLNALHGANFRIELFEIISRSTKAFGMENFLSLIKSNNNFAIHRELTKLETYVSEVGSKLENGLVDLFVQRRQAQDEGEGDQIVRADDAPHIRNLLQDWAEPSFWDWF